MPRHLVWSWLLPPADSYNLYKGMAAGAELLYKSGLPGSSYNDPEATPGSTYFGFVRPVNAGVEGAPTSEASVTVPTHDLGGPMSETHIFSTGILTAQIGAGAPITLALLQDVSFGAGYSRHDLYDAAMNSTHAVDNADHEGKWTIKAGNASFSGAAMQLLMASVLTTASAPMVPANAAGPGVPVSLNTLGGKIAFPISAVNLTLQDTAGHPVTVAATQSKAMGDQISFKLTDFALQNFELHCYPDPAFPDPVSGNRVAVITYDN